LIKTLWKEILRGKTLLRTLTNLWASSIILKGNGVDLGARNGKSSYYRFLKKDDDCNLMFSDLNPQSDDVLQVDLEKTIPLENESQDFLILIYVLEHLFDFQNCANETCRILKKNGKLYGSVPFLYQIHPDPDDNFRFTKSSLEKIFKQAGFSNIRITNLGFGPFSAGISQYVGVFKIKVLIFVITYFGIILDTLINRLFKNHPRVKAENFPLAYAFEAEK